MNKRFVYLFYLKENRGQISISILVLAVAIIFYQIPKKYSFDFFFHNSKQEKNQLNKNHDKTPFRQESN